jgi:hypothetical protein
MSKKYAHTVKVFQGLFAGLLFCTAVHADTIDKLSGLEGFYVLKVKTIDGWIDKDKKEKRVALRGVTGTELSFLTMARLQHAVPTATPTLTAPRLRFSSNPCRITARIFFPSR